MGHPPTVVISLEHYFTTKSLEIFTALSICRSRQEIVAGGSLRSCRRYYDIIVIAQTIIIETSETLPLSYPPAVRHNWLLILNPSKLRLSRYLWKQKYIILLTFIIFWRVHGLGFAFLDVAIKSILIRILNLAHVGISFRRTLIEYIFFINLNTYWYVVIINNIIIYLAVFVTIWLTCYPVSFHLTFVYLVWY